MQNQTTAIQKNDANSIGALLSSEAVQEQIRSAVPAHLSAERLLRISMTTIQQNPKLLECTQTSLLSCVLHLGQLGLEPGAITKHVALVPYWNKKARIYECQIRVMYQGFLELIRRTGKLSVSSHVVYEKDNFVLQFGLNEELTHFPYFKEDRGNPVGAYCVFSYGQGEKVFEFMATHEIEKIRKRSATANDGPWVTDWGEMAKKTVIRRLAKLAPMSLEYKQAAALDERILTGESQIDLLPSAKDPATFTANEKEQKKTAPAYQFESLAKMHGCEMTEGLEDYCDAAAATNNRTMEELKKWISSKPDISRKFFDDYKNSPFYDGSGLKGEAKK